MKLNRNLPSPHDPSSIANNTYNQAAGAQKNIEVGKRLVPLKYISGDALAYTCDATTRRHVGKGKSVAIYNNHTAVGSATVGDLAVTSLTAGAISGSNAGIPCKPNDWTYIALWENDHVITSAATLLVYEIVDDSYLVSTETV